MFRDVEQELMLVPPLVITDTPDAPATTTNVTIRVDLAAWFVDADGALIDPATANKGEPNEGLVEDNIDNSMEAFEDEDEDGEDDSSGSS